MFQYKSLYCLQSELKNDMKIVSGISWKEFMIGRLLNTSIIQLLNDFEFDNRDSLLLLHSISNNIQPGHLQLVEASWSLLKPHKVAWYIW